MSSKEIETLQAENSHLRQHKIDYMEAAEETRKALQAEIERLQQKLGREENEHCTTVNARDNAEKVADEMAKAIGEKFRVDVGEHSNMNCPWGMALSILNGEYVTDSDVERERDQLKSDLAERWEQIAELNSEAVQLKARNADLESALAGMVEYFPEGHSDGECFSVERARAALSKPAGSEQV